MPATLQTTSQVVPCSQARATKVQSKPVIASLSLVSPCFNVCARLGQPTILDTQFPFDVLKSHVFEFNVGLASVGTISLANSRTYERVPGKTLKAVILEAMELDHRTGAHVAKLDDELHDVMVSLCTSNACRKICSSEEVISYLEEDQKTASSEWVESFDEHIRLAEPFSGSTFAKLWAWLQEMLAKQPVRKPTESAVIVTLRL